ncbi:hypothetical protein KFU94_34680 [Chloroflexi bacterium TSY]|nr:hypothetical protein [Chloroflexi bacterium TSY]
MNRFVWDLRYPDCTKLESDPARSVNTGPMAVPGTYTVRLTVDGEEQSQEFTLDVAPGISASQEDLEAQFALGKQITDQLSTTYSAVNRVRRIREQVAHIAKQSSMIGSDTDALLTQTAKELQDKLTAIENAFIQTNAQSPRDRLRLPARLDAKLSMLMAVVASCDAAPTQQSYDVYHHLSSQVDEQVALLDGLLGDDIAAFNDLVEQSRVPAVVA